MGRMDLSFGGFQIAVLIGFLVVSGCLLAIFGAVAWQARRNVEYGAVTRTGYRLRLVWLIFLVVLLGTGVALSIAFRPYGQAANQAMTVEVSGYQFNWSVKPDRVPAGTEVVFDVTATDVNHGLGLYDPDGVLIGNVQAMPGYENRLSLTLERPGTYVFACLEFCGVGHHVMVRTFEVTP